MTENLTADEFRRGSNYPALHLIGNAHMDPVWIWDWREGFGEVWATFRSALDRFARARGVGVHGELGGLLLLDRGTRSGNV